MPSEMSMVGALKVIRDFGVHFFVGTSLFGVVATPAVACDFAVKWLQTQQVSEHVIYGLSGAEMTILASDLTLFVVFFIRSSIQHGKLLWQVEA